MTQTVSDISDAISTAAADGPATERGNEWRKVNQKAKRSVPAFSMPTATMFARTVLASYATGPAPRFAPFSPLKESDRSGYRPRRNGRNEKAYVLARP